MPHVAAGRENCDRAPDCRVFNGTLRCGFPPQLSFVARVFETADCGRLASQTRFIGIKQIARTCNRFGGTNRQIIVVYLEPVDLSGNFLGEHFSDQVRARFLRSALHNAETIPEMQPQGQGLLQDDLYQNIHGAAGVIPRLRHVLNESQSEYEVSAAHIRVFWNSLISQHALQPQRRQDSRFEVRPSQFSPCFDFMRVRRCFLVISGAVQDQRWRRCIR